MRAVLSDGFERAYYGEILTIVVARFDRPAVDEDRGNIHAGDSDHCARHVLIAAANGQHAIHALRLTRSLNGVSNHLPRDKAIFHPLRAHRDAVADGNRAEDLWHRAGIAEGGDGAGRQIVQPYIAWGNSAVTIRHTDDWFVEVFISETHGAQHGAVGCALGSICNRSTPGVMAH